MIEVQGRPKARTKKAPQDTVAGCRIRAEADLLASAAMLTANQRARHEKSAATWSARADLLQVLEDRFAARRTSRGAPCDADR
jgi:hypothetical protein